MTIMGNDLVNPDPGGLEGPNNNMERIPWAYLFREVGVGISKCRPI